MKLVRHMPFIGHTIKVDEVGDYSAPVIESLLSDKLRWNATASSTGRFVLSP